MSTSKQTSPPRPSVPRPPVRKRNPPPPRRRWTQEQADVMRLALVKTCARAALELREVADGRACFNQLCSALRDIHRVTQAATGWGAPNGGGAA